MANRYDPVANTWTPIAPIPVAVYATWSVYAANTNSIYVFDGFNGSTVQNTTQIYVSRSFPGGRGQGEGRNGHY